MFTPEQAMGVIETAAGCSHHLDPFTITVADIDVVFWTDYGCNHGSESAVRMKQEAEARKAAALAEGQEGLDDRDEFEGSDSGPCSSICDTWSEAYCRLKDGRYVVAHESSDTSGHGCQCSGSIEIFATKEEFLNLGMTEEQRRLVMRFIK